MEAGTVARPEAPPEPDVTYNGSAEATRSPAELFQWSKYLHLGSGAAECEHGQDGKCQEKWQPLPDGGVAGHFHVWVCLPNTFQIRDIGEKARAAKARKSRALRDPASDSYAVLEDELEELQRNSMDELITAAAKAEVDKQLSDIIDRLKEDERFEHQEQDAEEFKRLEALPDADRSSEEFDRLKAQMDAYAKSFDTIVAEQEAREREVLKRSPERAVEIERRSRIENIAVESYLHTYYSWAMFIGARRPVTEGFPTQRIFADFEDLRYAPPEVVVELRETIRNLEERTSVRSDAAGNS